MAAEIVVTIDTTVIVTISITAVTVVAEAVFPPTGVLVAIVTVGLVAVVVGAIVYTSSSSSNYINSAPTGPEVLLAVVVRVILAVPVVCHKKKNQMRAI